MKKLTAEEAKNIIPLKPGKYTLLYSQLIQLKPGEALIITTDDWVTNKPPYETIRRVMKNTGLKLEYGRMPDGSGWVVKRVS